MTSSEWQTEPDILSDSGFSEEVMGGADYVERIADLSLAIDGVLREYAPADWRGNDVREKEVQNVLFPLLDRNKKATKAVFELVKNMYGY